MTVFQDLRLALRLLRSRPGFATVAILTLALGLGANTAIFSVVYAVLLQPLSDREPDRLVFVWSTARERPIKNLTPGRLVDFRERARSFDGVAGISHIPLNLTGRATPERLNGASVSSNFFEVLGTPALLGRTFDPGGNSQSTVVLSHRLWQNTFGADSRIIGTPITLNGKPHTVIGVMPPSFVWPTVAVRPVPGNGPELWVPATRHEIPDTPIDRDVDLRLDRTTGYLRAVARLRPGVARDAADTEIKTIAAALRTEHPDTDAEQGGTVVSVRDHLLGPPSRPLFLMLGAAGFVLAIACANVANLLMGLAATRRREFEVRLALGAGRRRLLQQLLVESLVLSVSGALVGALVAWWALDVLIAAVPQGVLRLDQTSLSPIVMLFSVVLATLTAVIFGIVPAMHAWRLDAGSGLRDDSRTVGARTGRRTRSLIVAAEIAVAIVLTVGAALLVRSFIALQKVDVGLATDRLLTFDLFLTGERAQYQARQVEFYEQVLQRVRALPGVAAAGMAVTLPIGGDDFGAPVTIADRPLPPEGQEPSAGFQTVSPGYFDAAGMTLVAGRDLALTDTRDRQLVAVVNEAFAAAHWPGESPLGKRFRVGRDISRPSIEVVGVVKNMRHFGPALPPRAEFYQPYTQNSFPFMSVMVRTYGDPGALASTVRREIAVLDPSQPIARLTTMREHLRHSLEQPRFLSALTTLFGALALALAAIGIYGVMAWSVTVRVKEFGVRLALGARPSALMRSVLAEGMVVVAAGGAAGLAAAAILSGALRSFLFETSPTEAGVYVTAAAIVVSAAFVAIIVPARRAIRVNPLQALRVD